MVGCQADEQPVLWMVPTGTPGVSRAIKIAAGTSMLGMVRTLLRPLSQSRCPTPGTHGRALLRSPPSCARRRRLNREMAKL